MMRSLRTGIVLLLALALAAPAAVARAQDAPRVVVRAENPLALERGDETISVAWGALVRDLPALRPDRVRVLDLATGAEVVAQPLDADADGRVDELLFQSTFGPRETKRFAIEGAASALDPRPRAHARHVPRRDDIAWESDRVAFRTYGEGLWRLEPNTRTSGIDVWQKRTRELVVDRWYALEEEGKGSYHRDTGEGADFYTVGLSLGAGGTAIWRDGALHRALNFASHRVLADGPIRALVELEYEPRDIGGVRVSETKRIAIDAGQNLFRSESIFRVHEGAAGDSTLTYATGTVKRAALTPHTDRGGRWVRQTTWGPTDAARADRGSLGTAVLLAADAVAGAEETDDHFLVLARARAGAPAVHWAGAGWTASGDFADAEAWRAYVDAFAQRLAHPVLVTIEGAESP